MAEMKAEHTADGQEIVYRVYVHPETFNWLTVEELRKKMATQFEDHLNDILWGMKEENE